MKRYLVPSLCLLVIAGFLFWWLSPAQVVKRRTGKLMDTVTLSAGSGQAARQMGGYALSSLLAKEVVLDSPTIAEANGNFEREQIEAGFSMLAGQAKYTTFEIEEFKSVEVDGDQARVVAIVDAVVALSDYHPVDGKYEMELDWQREEDGWRLRRAKWTESR